jgi:hypothetical protein
MALAANALKMSYIQAFVLNPWTIWPAQAFPANEFKGWSQKRIQEARIAWDFFEQIEAADALLYISYGLSEVGASAVTEPNKWTVLETEETFRIYKLGQLLHSFVCPEISWVSHRYLPPTSLPHTLKTTIAAPPPVKNITLTASDQTVIVKWAAIPSIQYYTVAANPDNLTVQVPGSALGATLTGLTNNILYSFSVTATDFNGLTSDASISDLIAPIGPDI